MKDENVLYLRDRDNSPVENSVNFRVDGNIEMLSIRKDGFYVRGVKIDQDEFETRKVYDAFCEWLSKQNICK